MTRADISVPLLPATADLRSKTIARWGRCTLATRFALAATLAVCACMTVLGTWVSATIESGVEQNTAVTTAFYMESMIAPILQPLALEPTLPESAKAALNRVLTDTPLGRQIVTLKIWAAPSRRPSLSGQLLYSNLPELMDQTHEQKPAVLRAASGILVKERDPADKAHDTPLSWQDASLLEIHTPIYEQGTNRVIAIAEFHQKTELLQASINAARRLTFLVVGGLTLAMLVLLFTIVRKGSQTIATQQTFLRQRVEELSDALAHNEELRLHLVEARRRTGVTNERLLRRVGAELHDGPAQLVGLALLRLDAINPCDVARARAPEIIAEKREIFDIIRCAISDALNEIRSISAGIAPPHLKSVSLKRAIELASRHHEKRTGTRVDQEIDEVPEPVPLSMKLCLYRFTQEGLTNSFKHANGIGQKVIARVRDGHLTVVVSDNGAGQHHEGMIDTERLGLAGLRDRVESLEGEMTFDTSSKTGSQLVARFDLKRSNWADV